MPARVPNQSPLDDVQVVIGHSEGIDTRAVIEQVLDQCANPFGGRPPDVGLLFAAGDFDDQVLLDAIAERFPGLPLIGGHVAGAMCTSFGYTEDSVRLMLLQSDELTITVGVARDCGRNPDAAAQAVEMARRGHSEPEALCLSVFNVFIPGDPHHLLCDLNQALRPGCPVFGGAASPSFTDKLNKTMQSIQYFGREVLNDSMPIALISGPLSYSFSIENSWTPVGDRHRVTRANYNLVQRIGERTALELYQHYLGQHQEPAYAFPLAVFETDERGHERYYMRAPMAYDRDSGAVRYSGPIPEGATVQLTEAVRTTMLDQSSASVASAMHLEADATPALCMVFSCSMRKQILGTQTYREGALVTEQLDRHFGATTSQAGRDARREVPMLGIYAASELAPLFHGRSSMVHGATMITLLLGVRGQSEHLSPSPAKVEPASQSAVATDHPQLLARRLYRANALLAKMEEHRELNNALLRTISVEIDQSRQLVADKNRELQALYAELAQEKQKSDDLLLEILPRDVAEELKYTGQVAPVFYDSASVLFADFKGFTTLAAALSPPELLRELDYFFSEFDSICDQYGLEKLKTIGDAYMCAGGIPAETAAHAHDIVSAAWHMQSSMTAINAERAGRGIRPWQLRVGINTGPLMAGVIGKRKFAYDIWGNTVNIAARMESAGEAGRINISQTTYEKIRAHFACSHRGRIPVKNGGEVDMYFVDGPL